MIDPQGLVYYEDMRTFFVSQSTFGQAQSRKISNIFFNLSKRAFNTTTAFVQELAPLLLLCLENSSTAAERSELMQMLLWLSKRPDGKQRAAVATTLLLLMVGTMSAGEQEDAQGNDVSCDPVFGADADITSEANITLGERVDLDDRQRSPSECNEEIDSDESVSDANLTGEEILPICRQLVESKFFEQRLLGVHCIVVLTLHSIINLDNPPPRSIPPECLVDILVQCLEEEKTVDVRESMLSCLALLLCLPLSANRVVSITEAFVSGLEEHGWPSRDASNLARKSLFQYGSTGVDVHTRGLILLHMALGQTHYSNDSIQELFDVLQYRFTEYSCQSCQPRAVDPAAQNENHHQLCLLNEEDNLRITSIVKAIDQLLPYLLASLVKSAPDVENVTSVVDSVNSDSVRWMLEKLSQVVDNDSSALYFKLKTTLSQEWFKSWPLFDYLTNQLLPFLVSTLVHFEASNSSIVQAFIHLFHDWATCLGDTATVTHISPLFHKILSVAESDLEKIREGSTSLTRAPLVVFTFSILGSQHKQQSGSSSGSNDPTSHVSPLQEFLTRHVSIVCLCGGSLVAIEHSITSLLTALPLTQDAVLAVLWACLVNKSSLVRAASAQLWTIAAGELTMILLLTFTHYKD